MMIIIMMYDLLTLDDLIGVSSASLCVASAPQALTGVDEAVVEVNHCFAETGGVRGSLVKFQSVKINDI